MFMNASCRLLDMDDAANSWGDNIIIACDEPQLDIPVTQKITLYRFSFMPVMN